MLFSEVWEKGKNPKLLKVATYNRNEQDCICLASSQKRFKRVRTALTIVYLENEMNTLHTLNLTNLICNLKCNIHIEYTLYIFI